MNTYKCEQSRFAELERRIKSITRKLNRHGLECHFRIVDEYPQAVKYLVECPETQCLANHGTIVVDVVEYEFDMPELKLSGWTPIAVLKHDQTIDTNSNVVIAINGYDTNDIPKEYWTASATCEHCHSKRRRNTTVLLKNAQGELIQVGSTCVKDFTGINAEDIIRTYADVTDIIETPLEFRSFDAHIESKYALTKTYLAACIAEISKSGYEKDEKTKYKAWDRVKIHEEFTDAQYETAQKILNFFEEMNPDDFGANWSFYQNIKNALANEYTKPSGFVAYAPIAYESAIKYMEKKSAEEASKDKSQWVGAVKDRVTLTLEHVRTHGYESYYGWGAIHIFKDTNGNTFVWNTDKKLCDILGEEWRAQDKRICEVTGTIKAHDTYNGEKQTVLTRCKLKAL